LRDGLGQVARQDTEPGADLEHHVARVELRETADHAQDVRVDQKVLAQALARCDRHRPNTRVAFVWICVSRSPRLIPRRSASTSYVCRTNPGSFRRPRTACGAR